ncbi:MAG: cryptochrome/photolyase family protein [Geminicoccaceae bacterium]|nr:cryptochrome/photolyase family protein [Geminicoccaceae bacterium]MCX8102019.1 cryptochrome/photolyase family protein [Geminicoccaceae bacterium]MDW8369905.1 cryptochrome/photolyase family protein [Geminicoccaceae bacterium]
MTTLRYLFADHLSRSVSSLAGLDPHRDVVLMTEVMAECTYVPHHPKKIAFLFSAMRHFAAALAAEGVRVDYVRLDDPANRQSFSGEIRRAVERYRPERIVLCEPGEWRVLEEVRGWETALGVPVEIRPDDRFFCSIAEFRSWAADRRQLRMELFYRWMRERTGILMTAAGEPEGGRWNYDVENRKPPPRGRRFPAPLRFAPDAITREVLALVGARFRHHFGELEPFGFAVTAEQAEAALEHFLKSALPWFGDYQDAMVAGEDWLFHSALSPYLNTGLLLPRTVCARVEAEYRAGRVPLNSAEGFIRQILGWREYVRGVYWRAMPGYATLNALGADAPLPALYWTGRTAMACVRHAIDCTRREAMSHHIQRLMLTGNLALLLGVRPEEVCAWYLAVYADAFEWVELPNTLGMALHADGGLMASKPYAASGAYIDRMSDFCGRCRYDVRAKNGRDACPFNYLFWDFLIRNRDRLARNPRMGQMYRTLDRLAPERIAAICADAARFRAALARGEEV